MLGVLFSAVSAVFAFYANKINKGFSIIGAAIFFGSFFISIYLKKTSSDID